MDENAKNKREAKASRKDEAKSLSSVKVHNVRRGRKREPWEQYITETREKIAEYRDKLAKAKDNGDVPAKTIQGWRNLVSA